MTCSGCGAILDSRVTGLFADLEAKNPIRPEIDSQLKRAA